MVQSGSMYEQYDGYRLGKAERVNKLTRNLNNSYFHLERQGFSVANFDWIMIDPNMSASAFERISERYGILLITPGVMLTLPPRDAPFESKVIVYMDEPPGTTSFTDLRDRAAMTLIKVNLLFPSLRGAAYVIGASSLTFSPMMTCRFTSTFYRYITVLYLTHSTTVMDKTTW